MTKNNKECYVYRLIDPRNNEIFYVGKGKNNRMKSHISRAKKWHRENRKTKVANPKLYNKIIKILESGLDVICEKVLVELSDAEACLLEKALIAEIGLNNLCNLSNGGESGKHSKETIEKIKESRKHWLQSPDFEKFKQKLSTERQGSGNPRYGHKEDPEKTKLRMANMLSKPRWNKGLKGDPRAKGPPKGNIPPNALIYQVLDLRSDVVTEGYIKEIVSKLKIPEVTVKRMALKRYHSKKWSSIYLIRIKDYHGKNDVWNSIDDPNWNIQRKLCCKTCQ